MRRSTITAIWLLGALAALLAYWGNPDRLLAALAAAVSNGLDQVWIILDQLDLLRPNVVRALAVGLFVIFAGLAVVSIRRGAKGRAALVLVTAAFLWEAGDPNGWVQALMLSATGAAVMTARVMGRTARPHDLNGVRP